jgi:hypothetical protein
MSDPSLSSLCPSGVFNGGQPLSPSRFGSSSGGVSNPPPAPPSYDARNSSLAGALHEPSENGSSWSDRFRSLPTPDLHSLEVKTPEWRPLLEAITRLLNTSASKVTFHLRDTFADRVSLPLPTAAQNGEDFACKVVGPTLADAVYQIVLKQFYRGRAMEHPDILGVIAIAIHSLPDTSLERQIQLLLLSIQRTHRFADVSGKFGPCFFSVFLTVVAGLATQFVQVLLDSCFPLALVQVGFLSLSQYSKD